MSDLTHDQAAELLSEAALDGLPAEEQAAVLAHAASCPQCGPALASLRDAVGHLAFALPVMADDTSRRARARSRLLARARADVAIAEPVPRGASGRSSPSGAAPSAAASVGATARPRVPGGSSGSRGGWAVAGLTALAAGLLVAGLVIRERDAQRELAQVRTEDARRLSALSDSLATTDSLMRRLTGQRVAVMQLTAAAARAPWAWMFWDRGTNNWTLVAHNLPPVRSGRTYQLWLVTAKSKISAGTFMPGPDGTARLEATYALSPDSLRALAVTEEPAGGVPEPTGPIVMGVQAGK
jgi:hypothetical protein